MTAFLSTPGTCLPGPSDGLLAELEQVYVDIHANPELWMQERRTASIAAKWLRAQGFEVTEGVGSTGVVGLLHNGEGATVLLRADMDGLPMQETTGLSYASKATGTDRFGQPTSITHSCGHDFHVTWLMGVTRILAENRNRRPRPARRVAGPRGWRESGVRQRPGRSSRARGHLADDDTPAGGDGHIPRGARLLARVSRSGHRSRAPGTGRKPRSGHGRLHRLPRPCPGTCDSRARTFAAHAGLPPEFLAASAAVLCAAGVAAWLYAFRHEGVDFRKVSSLQ